MRVLVTGVTGQLGYDVCQTLARQGIPFTGVSSSECDIADERAVRSLFERVRPDAVIHCAAYTKVVLGCQCGWDQKYCAGLSGFRREASIRFHGLCVPGDRRAAL